VNINSYAFLFGEWILLLITAYLIFIKQKFGLGSEEGYSFYRMFIMTMIQGGVFLQTVSTIRLWYWDQFYTELAIEREKKMWDDWQQSKNETQIVDDQDTIDFYRAPPM
jgi:hypothetical protein